MPEAEPRERHVPLYLQLHHSREPFSQHGLVPMARTADPIAYYHAKPFLIVPVELGAIAGGEPAGWAVCEEGCRDFQTSRFNAMLWIAPRQRMGPVVGHTALSEWADATVLLARLSAALCARCYVRCCRNQSTMRWRMALATSSGTSCPTPGYST